MSVEWLDPSGNTVGTGASTSLAVNNNFARLEWDPLCMEATAPDGAASARVKLQVLSGSGGKLAGSAWFDDVVLLPID